jgi:hypothetical protein
MSKHKTDKEAKILPKPVALTREQVQQVAAGTAAVLPRTGATILKGIPVVAPWLLCAGK